MNLGMLFMLIALIFFFLEGVGALANVKLLVWGLFSLTLGLLLSGIPIPWK